MPQEIELIAVESPLGDKAYRVEADEQNIGRVIQVDGKWVARVKTTRGRGRVVGEPQRSRKAAVELVVAG